jgi:hypothetical protein
VVDHVRCTSCHRNVAAGVEAQKMIVEYRQSDGSLKLFGYMMGDGPITAATGAMVRGWHHKCYWIQKKREARGDAVSGRVVPGTPSAYTETFADDVVKMSAKLDRLRTLAESMGKGVGDAQVTEAFNAAERGGPYPHGHGLRYDTYQLVAHLEYAHGVSDVRLLRTSAALHEQHAELHSRLTQPIQVDR